MARVETYFLHVNEHTHEVIGVPLEELRSRIVDASRAGGAMLSLPGASGGWVLVLITPASAVWVECAPEPISVMEESDDASTEVAFLEFEDL